MHSSLLTLLRLTNTSMLLSFPVSVVEGQSSAFLKRECENIYRYKKTKDPPR